VRHLTAFRHELVELERCGVTAQSNGRLLAPTED